MILNLKPPDETPMEPLPPFWYYAFRYADDLAKLLVVAFVVAAILSAVMEWVR